jgi:hypothetical protein
MVGLFENQRDTRAHVRPSNEFAKNDWTDEEDERLDDEGDVRDELENVRDDTLEDDGIEDRDEDDDERESDDLLVCAV